MARAFRPRNRARLLGRELLFFVLLLMSSRGIYIGRLEDDFYLVLGSVTGFLVGQIRFFLWFVVMQVDVLQTQVDVFEAKRGNSWRFGYVLRSAN